MRSNRVTRQISFNRTKIGGKCQNSKIQMWLFEEFSNNVLLQKIGYRSCIECQCSFKIGSKTIVWNWFMKTGFEWVDFTWSKFLFILRSKIPHHFLLGTYYRTRLWLTALIKLKKKMKVLSLHFWVHKYVRVGAIFKNWDIKDHHSTMTSFLSSWATIATVAFSERRKIWENWL